jgi:predicted ArsR family transcriptional regulator
MAMTLTDAKAYLMERRRATLGDIATHFGSSPDAAREIMRRWVEKGRVKLQQGKVCKTGCHCDNRPDDVYEWLA